MSAKISKIFGVSDIFYEAFFMNIQHSDFKNKNQNFCKASISSAKQFFDLIFFACRSNRSSMANSENFCFWDIISETNIFRVCHATSITSTVKKKKKTSQKIVWPN